MILWPLIALLGAGSAPLLAQEPAAGRAAQPAPRAGQAARPAQPQAKPIQDPAKMKWLLKAWEKQSEKLKTLDVQIYRIDKDYKWKDEVHFEGRAVFKSPNLAYLDFKKIKLAPDANGRPAPVKDPKTGKWVTTPTETIVCGQDAVWQYLYEGRQIYIFPLAKGQRQRALDEGPLPFLFNMKAQEAERRYEMVLQAENEKYYLVKVFPKLQEDKESFKMALLYLEKTYLLPARIALVSPDGKSSRDFLLDKIKPNKEISPPSLFQGGVFKGWKVVQNPAADAPRQGNAAERAGGVGRMLRR
jgi:TIGR03009 family protein